jgi:hypothetical protein
MTKTTHFGPAIRPGYPWRMRIRFKAAGLLPEGVALKAQVRQRADASSVLAELTTAAGSLARVSATEIDILMGPEHTGPMQPGAVELDLVRTDVTPAEHLGFLMRVPVRRPVTR